MTREEAIKLFRRDIECLSHDKCSDCILEEACDPMKTPPDSEYIAAYGMAIEALSAEPCEDAISRAWLKEAIHNFYYGLKHTPTEEDIQAYIDVAPSVTPKQKMGHWINYQKNIWIYAQCSECGTVHDTKTNYCPNCGAKMEEGENG